MPAQPSPASRKFLGKGWAFPVRPIAGKLVYAEYEDDVEQAIGIILETSQRERVMRPTFGAGLRDYVFDSNSPVTHRTVEAEVRTALTAWEPRISTQAVTVYPDPDHANVMMIAVDYTVRATNSTFNLVYPFYVTEGV